MYVLTEALRGMGKNRLMSLLSLGVVGISLFILGLFLLVTGNIFKMIQLAEEKVEIVAYLEDDLREGELATLRSKAESLDGVEEVSYVSKEQAMAWLREELKEDPDLLQALETNPLPPSFEAKVAQNYRNPDDLSKIADDLGHFPGVVEVDYGKEWVERLDTVAQVLVGVDLLLMVFFSLVSIFLVANTIKLTVFARREQIEIMELVGATHRFIRAPFLMEGFLQGVIGGGLASLCLYGLYGLISIRVQEAIFLSKEILAGLIGFGGLLGFLGSLFSVRRFLSIPKPG